MLDLAVGVIEIFHDVRVQSVLLDLINASYSRSENNMNR
jgi:hypothetical protein